MVKKRSKENRVAKKEGLESFFKAFPGRKKNLDNLKLLASYPIFREEIKAVRQRLGIPNGGFGLENPKSVHRWQIDIAQTSEDTMRSQSFREQIRAIGKKLADHEISENMAAKQSALLHASIPLNNLGYTARFLVQKFNIPANYEESMRDYIIYGAFLNLPGGFEIDYSPSTIISIKETPYIPIKIYSELTDDDLRELKKTVKMHGKHLPKFQSLSNLDSKLTMEAWFEDRLLEDIAVGKSYKMTAGEIAENLLGDKRRGKKVYETVRQLKSLRKRRFGKRLG
jgi:hypothetical protein